MDRDICARVNFKKTRIDIFNIPGNHSGVDKKYDAFSWHRRKAEPIRPSVTKHVHNSLVVLHHSDPGMCRLRLLLQGVNSNLLVDELDRNYRSSAYVGERGQCAHHGGLGIELGAASSVHPQQCHRVHVLPIHAQSRRNRNPQGLEHKRCNSAAAHHHLGQPGGGHYYPE